MTIKSSADLASYLAADVPIFGPPTLLVSGVAYHYTTHWEKIRRTNKLYGAPITPNLAQTQTEPGCSPPATCKEGVIFAYLSLKKTRQEGATQQIVKIHFLSALSAMQTQEEALLEHLTTTQSAFSTFRYTGGLLKQTSITEMLTAS